MAASKNGRTVLVLGGGVGGVVAARTLRRRLGDRDRVVLIEREANHLFQSSLLWLLVGQRAEEVFAAGANGMVVRGVR